MKIRTAIFVVYVAASAVGFAVLMRYMLAEVRPRYVNALHYNLEAAARLLAASLDGRAEPTAVDALRAANSGLRVRIVRDDGAVLLDTSESTEAEVEDYSAVSSGLAKRAAIGLLDENAFDGATEIGASAPLTFADGGSGTVVLSRPIRTVNAFVWAERKKLASIGLLIAGVMLIAGWWIAARLTHAIEKLTVYAQAVRDGRRVAPPRSRASEIATLTKAFDEMRDALEGRQHAERYTQALAHEVKAPLAAIRGAAELLDEDMSEEQRRRFMANIREQSARIQQIVERLLELSSLEARKSLRQTERIDVAELVEEAANVVRPAFAAEGVALAVEGVGHVGELSGERVLLREALVNLLQNALDFSPKGGRVVMRCAAGTEGGRVEFAVEDEGPGVPDYALARVFERFYSLPRPGTDRKSTGLGLALVREVAHLHGGGAALENREAGGARATIWVPAQRVV